MEGNKEGIKKNIKEQVRMEAIKKQRNVRVKEQRKRSERERRRERKRIGMNAWKSQTGSSGSRSNTVSSKDTGDTHWDLGPPQDPSFYFSFMITSFKLHSARQ